MDFPMSPGRSRLSRRGRFAGAAAAREALLAFGACVSGIVAIEFAFLLPMFAAVLFAALEIGTVYFVRSDLDLATQEAARAVMTHQVTTSAQLTSTFCSELSALIDCNSLMINLTPYTSLGSVNAGNPVLTFNADGTVANSFTQTFGATGNVMVLEVVYQFPVVGSGLIPFISQHNGYTPIVSNYVFVEE